MLPGRSPAASTKAAFIARPSSAFLAQLIITAQHAPQTRARGRIEPADAIATYINGENVSNPPQGKEWLV